MLKQILPIALLFSQTATGETMLERLCFASEQAAQQAIPIVNTVLVKGQDEITQEGGCLNINVDDKRSDVFDRWVTARLPQARRDFTTINRPLPMCDIRVGKREVEKQNSESVQIGNSVVSASAGSGTVTTNEVSTLNLASGKSGSLTIDRRHVDIHCVKKNSGTYQIRITLIPLPPLVVHPQIASPPLKNAVGFSTEVNAVPGQEVPLGQIVKDLTSKERSVDLPADAETGSREGESSSTWWLKVL